MPGARAMFIPWFALGAGWVCNHLFGPATLSVWQSQFYMMRFNITQPIFTSIKDADKFRHQKLETQS
jgi:hypothetical protein